ncbi:MAG: hypothetical protein ACT4O0_19060 [Pseudonocardia sp.]
MAAVDAHRITVATHHRVDGPPGHHLPKSPTMRGTRLAPGTR